MKTILILLAISILAGCSIARPPQTERQVIHTPEISVPTPVCAYGGQINGSVVVCNPRFTPVGTWFKYSQGYVMFDARTARTCWSGPEYGQRGSDAVFLPTCSSL